MNKAIDIALINDINSDGIADLAAFLKTTGVREIPLMHRGSRVGTTLNVIHLLL